MFNLKIILSLILSLTLIYIIIGYTSFNQPEPQILSATQTNSPPTPSPFPFQDLTLPYLRNQTYSSTLSELKPVIDADTYTGYLTSYLSDNLKINGLLTVPKSDPPELGFPAVVFVHGYIPPPNYRTLENYQSYVTSLASQSLVVFKIDLRGHADSSGEASGAYYSGDYVRDTLNAYSALQSNNFVDPNRIGLWGHSMGGNVVFRAFVAKKNIPKVVIWAGAVYSYSDFSEYRISDNSYQPPLLESPRQRHRDLLFNTYGSFDPNSWFWSQVPATNYLTDVQGAIQLHHAINDTVVDIKYSRNLVHILTNTPIPHQLFEYNSGGHNLTGASFSQALSRTANFLKQQ